MAHLPLLVAAAGVGVLDGLSPRQRQVALHAVRGSRTRDIAALPHLPVPTVQQHVTAILHRTGVRNRRELVAVLTADHLPTLALPPKT
ncbi:helix-turn-helix domain-containing protein [Kitasatospora purpeofusca]|uniref:helix-turn-helix domain-containing protein n=1 Tax=Kitasatospora purpeofusca TaxID=67352 RepID=UPI0038102298